MTRLSRRVAVVGSLALLLVGIFGIFLGASRDQSQPGSSSTPPSLAPTARLAAAANSPRRAGAPEGPVAPKPTGTLALAAVDSDVTVGHAHPITDAHRRLRRERLLLSRLNRAVDAHDGGALQDALDQYKDEFPEDEQRLQEGYGVIAKCLVAPGPTSRTAATTFYAEHRGSSLRRWVRRVCLE